MMKEQLYYMMEKVRFFDQPYLLYYGDLAHVRGNLIKFNIGFTYKDAIPYPVFICKTIGRK